MSMDVGGSSGPEINVTPLIDIVLVLLIIFMVITPMANDGADVKLPLASELEEEEGAKDKSDALTVSIDMKERLFVDGQEVSEGKMIGLVSARFSQNPNAPIVLRADSHMEVEPIRKLMRQLKNAGARRINLAIDVEKQGGGE